MAMFDKSLGCATRTATTAVDDFVARMTGGRPCRREAEFDEHVQALRVTAWDPRWAAVSLAGRI